MAPPEPPASGVRPEEGGARRFFTWSTRRCIYTAIGQPKYYRTCPGIFFCGNVPYESKAGAPARPDLDKARQLMKESGYDGRPAVVLDPTDRPELHGAALVTRELLTKIGVAVDLQAMDWSTLVSRRAKKEPPSRAGGTSSAPTGSPPTP